MTAQNTGIFPGLRCSSVPAWGLAWFFWGVAEPIFHYAQPPMGIEPLSNQSAMMSFRYTFLHWGFHLWAIYAIVGPRLAYVTFRKNALSDQFNLYPLLGEKTRGPIGQVIDILALILTVIGVATSLGMGALQVNGGLNTLFNIPNNISTQVIIIIVITVLFFNLGNHRIRQRHKNTQQHQYHYCCVAFAVCFSIWSNGVSD